jgi:hypothetical protein
MGRIEMRCDLHIHTKYSRDGILEPDTVVKVAIRKGMNGIAITDHNTIMGGLRAKECETDDFKVIVGSEIATNRGEISGLFLEKEIGSKDYHEVVDEIKRQGGIVVIPHPFDRLRKSKFTPTREDVKLIDCIEGFNSRCIFRKDNEKAVNFAMKYNLKVIAGSDAHFKNEIGKAVIESSEANEDLRKIILNGKFKIFGDKSSLLNHAFTKTMKWFRKNRRW